MDGERIRHDLALVVVATDAISRRPLVAVEGRLVAYEDGRWRLFLAGAEAAREGRDEGGREAVTALLRLLVESDPAAPTPVIG